MRSIFSRRGAVTIALAVGALFTGVAFALWTSSGTGSGSARAIQAQAATVSAETGTADLYPGFAGGDLHFKVTNPNPYPVQFTSMTPGTVTSSSPTGCPAGNVSVNSASGLTITVPANTTTAVPRSIADVVSMDANASDGCQGATFSVALTLSGSQQ